MAVTVLFLCHDNAVLSPMAEAYLNAAGEGDVRAFSAGLEPAARLGEGVAGVLGENGIPVSGLQPKAWQLFALDHAPMPDMVIALTPGLHAALRDAWPRHVQRADWQVPGVPASGAMHHAAREATREAFRAIRRATRLALDHGSLRRPARALRRSA